MIGTQFFHGDSPARIPCSCSGRLMCSIGGLYRELVSEPALVPPELEPASSFVATWGPELLVWQEVMLHL